MCYYDGEFLFLNFVMGLSSFNIFFECLIFVFLVFGFVLRVYDYFLRVYDFEGLVIIFKVFYGFVFIFYVLWNKYN